MAVLDSSKKMLKVTMPLSLKIPNNEFPKSIAEAKEFFFMGFKTEQNIDENIQLLNIRAMLCWISCYKINLKKIKQKTAKKSISFIISFENDEDINDCIKELNIHVVGVETEIID